MNKISVGAVILVATSLSACGGDAFTEGGGNNNQPPPANGVTITSDNAMQVTSTATGAALSGVEADGFTGVLGAGGGGGGATKPQPMKTASVVAKGTIDDGAISNVPIPPTTTPCAVSGSTTISGDLADPLTYTAGDTINVDSDNCDDGIGEVVDGLIEMTITSFDGDIFTESFLLGIDLVVTDFSVTIEGVTEVANGDIGSLADTRQAPTLTSSVFGDLFQVVSNGQTESLSDFRTDLVENGNTWTNDSFGTINSTELAGSVDYTTTTPFSGVLGEYPNAGVLVVTGANNASLTLTTIDNVSVQIEADYDGNGSIDETIMTTWAELEGGV